MPLLPSDYISNWVNVGFITMLSYLAARPSLEPRPCQVFILGFFCVFFLPDWPTHHHKRWGGGKWNILLGWPKIFGEITEKLHKAFLSKGRGAGVAAGLNVIFVCSGFKQVQNPCDVSDQIVNNCLLELQGIFLTKMIRSDEGLTLETSAF